MSLRQRIEQLYASQVQELVRCPGFRAIETGTASRERYDEFIGSVVRTHIASPQLVAFLYALAPPAAAPHALENLLEEVGQGPDGDPPHPALLRDLAIGAGLQDRLLMLEAEAAAETRRVAGEPILFNSLQEVGLAALVEITAFEYMLSRVAGRIARALLLHRGLSAPALRWFTLHAEVDLAHAEQGVEHLQTYIRYYGFSEENAMAIVELTLRQNVFVKRYLGERVLAQVAGMLPV